MAILKIKDICLVTGLFDCGGECVKAYEWLTDSGVKFNHLGYWHPSDHAELFRVYNTWVQKMDLKTFPFVHYMEIDTDFNMRPVFLIGLDEIKNSNLVELSQL